MILDDVADVRTGDKGDDLIIALLPRDAEAYERVTAAVTAQRVAEHYGLPPGAVRRVLMPTVTAMVFHLRGVLGGGVTGSSYLDGHGKTMGYHLLSLPLD
ncbi:AtuA-related protein [Brevibacterium yomogidense]|uniref:AtuA-related protein n=1 Tax=Brevibacterium yomogidense TaxID=946573 RepID=UPI0018DF9484|nr:hypothetical protein [Brevibacterium yomogidense]